MPERLQYFSIDLEREIANIALEKNWAAESSESPNSLRVYKHRPDQPTTIGITGDHENGRDPIWFELTSKGPDWFLTKNNFAQKINHEDQVRILSTTIDVLEKLKNLGIPVKKLYSDFDLTTKSKENQIEIHHFSSLKKLRGKSHKIFVRFAQKNRLS